MVREFVRTTWLLAALGPIVPGQVVGLDQVASTARAAADSAVPWLMPLEGSARWTRWLENADRRSDVGELIAALLSAERGGDVPRQKLRAFLMLCDIAPRCHSQLEEQQAKLHKAHGWYESLDLPKGIEAQRRSAAALVSSRVETDEQKVRVWVVSREPLSVVDMWCAVEWCLFHPDKGLCRPVLLRLLDGAGDRLLHKRDHLLLRSHEQIEHLWVSTLLTAAAIARFDGVDGDGELRAHLVAVLGECTGMAPKLQSARLLLSIGRLDEARRLISGCGEPDSLELTQMLDAVTKELAAASDK